MTLLLFALCSFAAVQASAQGWSAETLRFLNDPKPLKPDTDRMPVKQRDAARQAAAAELTKGFEAIVAPLSETIRATVGDITFHKTSPQADLGADQSVDPWEPIWVFRHSLMSVEETEDRVAYGPYPYGHASSELFKLELTINFGASAVNLAAEAHSYKARRDEIFFNEKFYKSEDFKAYKAQLDAKRKAAAEASCSRPGASKMFCGAFSVSPANEDLISLGANDDALVVWDVESRRAEVRWHRGGYMAKLAIVAPGIGEKARDHAIAVATQIDGLLEKHGFYAFPLGAGAGPAPLAATPSSKLLSVDLLDANPMFSPSGATLPADRTVEDLIAADTLRIGTTADGISHLVLRAELDGEADVTFSLAGAEDGTVEPLFGRRTVADGERHFAFALYTPPDNLHPLPEISAKPKSPLIPPERRLGGVLEVRDVVVSMQIGGAAQQANLLLAQPPVVLVHGLFSDPVQTWVNTFDAGSSMAAVLERAGFLPFLVNYQDTNGSEGVGSWLFDDTSAPPSAFKNNASVVWDSPRKDHTPIIYEGFFEAPPILAKLERPDAVRIGGISQALSYYRDELNLAATQATVMGHSMGGILARFWASDGRGGYNPAYKRPENFHKGDIDRLITLNTPHHGSELAELKDAFLNAQVQDKGWLKWVERQAGNTALWWVFEPERGAVSDLRPTSAALQRIGKTEVPAFAIATSYDESDAGTPKNDPLKLYQTLYSFAGTIFFENRPLLDDFVARRAASWRDAPTGAQKETDWNGRPGIDFADVGAVERYKGAFARAMDAAVFYWATIYDDAYRKKLHRDIADTVILPFGLVDWSMGDDDELHMLTKEYLTQNHLARPAGISGLEGPDATRVPEAFLAMLRHLVFQNDAQNDGAVRVESQTGDLDEGATKPFKHVIHSYSPWTYEVQSFVVSLLRYETDRFDEGGFPPAGRPLPRYLPSTALADASVNGVEAIAWSGMVPSHAQEYLAAADRNDAFVLVRPVNPASGRLLRKNAAAKGMNVKGKSSNWGPQVGLIPFDQRYSKIWRVVKDLARRRVEIKKYNEETESSTTTPYPPDPERRFAVAQPLREVKSTEGLCDVLTRPDIDDAEAAVVLHCGDGFYWWQNAAHNGKSVYDPGRELDPMELTPEQQQAALAHPMLVLADDTSDRVPRPNLTADYDLLAIGFRFEPWQCASGRSPKPGEPVQCTPGKPRDVPDQFDKLRGYIGAEQWKLVSEINDAVRDNTGYSGGLVTHHGPENQYPKSPYIDYPILIFDPMNPDDTHDGAVYLIRMGPPGFRDIHLKRFFTEKNRLGYNLWPNPKSPAWRWGEFDPVRGYVPRDAANLPPYVEEAPRPDEDRIAMVETELASAGKQKADAKSEDVAKHDTGVETAGDAKQGDEDGKDQLEPLLLDLAVTAPGDEMPGGLGLVEKMSFMSARNGKASAQRTVAEWFEYGVRAPKDDAEALAWYALAAGQGDAEALYKIAQAYEFGRLGLTSDGDVAARWTRAAAERGHAAARIDVSHAYQNGLGVPKDANKALHWLTLAAEQGDDMAQFYLAAAYAEGEADLVVRDLEQALKWYTAAAEQGLAPAQVALGFAYFEGTLTVKDAKSARVWFERAARQGATRAQIAIGDMYRWGDGAPLDFGQAQHWYEQAADQGDSEGHYRLGLLYEQIEHDVKSGSERSIYFLTQSAEAGHLEAAYRLGDRYHFGLDIEADLAKAAHFLTLAAERGHTAAQADLGLLYELGKGVEQSYETAAELYGQATLKGNPKAQTGLALLYRDGLGVEQDIDLAVELIKLAAEQKDAIALYHLGTFHADGIGAEHDFVRAYMYFDLAAAISAYKEMAEEKREEIGALISPVQREQAREYAQDWLAAHTGPQE